MSTSKTQLIKIFGIILDACTSIIQEVEGLREHDLWGDKALRALIEGHLIRIGEALELLRDVAPQQYTSLTDAETAIRFGRVLRDKHEKIDYGIVWRSILHNIPLLMREAGDLRAAIRR